MMRDVRREAIGSIHSAWWEHDWYEASSLGTERHSTSTWRPNPAWRTV